MRFLFCTGASAAVEPEALTPEQLARLRTSNTAAKAAVPTYTEPPSPDSSDYEASEMTTQGQEELPDQPPPPLQMMSSAFPSSSSAHGAPLAPLAPLRPLGHSTATSTIGSRALPPLGRSSQVLPRLEGRAPLLEISAVGRSTNGDGNAATFTLEQKTTRSSNLPPPSPLVRCATSNEVAAFVKPSGSAGFKERPRPLPAPSALALAPVQLPPAAPATAPSMPGSRSLAATLPTSLVAIPTLAADDMATDGEAAAPAAAPAIPPAMPSAAPAAPPPAAPAPAAAPKSALVRPSSSKGGGGRRLSFAAEEKVVFVYEAGQEPPIDDYKANMQALNEMRRRREREALAQLTFAELVSELDASEGGEGLACLAPRRVDPPPGSWQRARASAAGGGSSAGQLTWGQLTAKPPPI